MLRLPLLPAAAVLVKASWGPVWLLQRHLKAHQHCPCRQLLAAETPAQVFVSTLVTTKNATATAGLLSSAMAVGSLASTLNVMGLHIESLNVTQDQVRQEAAAKELQYYWRQA